MARPDPAWWRAEVQDLQRLGERVSTLYVERTHIDRDENAVILINKERTVRVPAAMVAVVLIGPGTRITHGAVNVLADSGTAICWVGEHGVRFYAAGLGLSRGTRLLERQAYLVSRVPERLAVARRMYAMRFPDEDVSTSTMKQLRGREGARIRRIYREESKRTGVEWERRSYREGDPDASMDDINRALSAAHACLYGLVFAAVTGLGASPGLGFIHQGSARSFVLDIADLYKADYTIPLAFDLTAEGWNEEREIRLAFRDRIADGHLLQRMIKDIQDLLLPDSSVDDDTDRKQLWDEKTGSVPSGVDWASPGHVIVSGPDLTGGAST